MHILAFAASNSSRSINAKLIGYVADLIEEGLIGDATVETLDLIDYEMAIYSIDREEADGIPEPAHRFRDAITRADALIVSFAEHNGHYVAAYKNLYDWTSRIDRLVYQEKPMVLLATSPGGRGGQRVLGHAIETARIQGVDVRASLAVPNFNDNYDADTGRITNPEIDEHLRQAIATLTPR